MRKRNLYLREKKNYQLFSSGTNVNCQLINQRQILQLLQSFKDMNIKRVVLLRIAAYRMTLP